MVATIKFSQFSAENLSNHNQYVGVGAGVNFIGNTVVTWTTITRPLTPYAGLIGYNSTIGEYEYYNDTIAAWVQLTSTTSIVFWNNVTASSAQMVETNGYVANNAGIVTLTLPVLCEFGTTIDVAGYGSGGWTIVFNAGQNLVFGKDVATTTTGSISSTNQYDQVELLCVVSNTTWVVRNVQGNLTVV